MIATGGGGAGSAHSECIPKVNSLLYPTVEELLSPARKSGGFTQ